MMASLMVKGPHLYLGDSLEISHLYCRSVLVLIVLAVITRSDDTLWMLFIKCQCLDL